MLIRFFKWFRGYVYVRIEGYSPERFINLCRHKKILIWNMTKVGVGYEFYMTVDGFQKVRGIARKTHTRPKIIKKKGFVFQERKMKKHNGFLIGACLFAVLVYMLSLFIWDISLEGNHSYTEDVIFEYLLQEGVKPGILKRNVNCQQIEELIRKKYTDIGWVSAEIKGTKLNLKIVETNMPALFEKSDKPCHIIAMHDGIIESIITRQGTPVVEKGDKVKKGDILVSGILDIMNDNGEVVKKEPVAADSDIYLRTAYQYKKTIPVSYKKHVKTGRKITRYSICILGKEINLYNPFKKLHSTKKYDIIATVKNIRLTHSFVLPLSYTRKEYEEYYEKDSTYQKKELVSKQKEYYALYISRLKKNGVMIEEQNASAGIENGYCVAKGTLTVLEPQHEIKDIKETEWRITKTDEYSGDNT